jgi:hypothetical protein
MAVKLNRAALIAVLALAAPVQSATVTTGCGLAWDYPAASLPLIDGFKVYVNGTLKVTVPADEQTVLCTALGLTGNASYTAQVSAYNAVGESARSNSLPFVFVSSAPSSAPTNLRPK